MTQNYAISIIRTLVPMAVGCVAAWLVAKGIHVPAAARDSAVAVLTAGCGALYYLLARVLEHKWPALGVLLGVPAKPTYPEIAGVDKPQDASVTPVTVAPVAAVNAPPTQASATTVTPKDAGHIDIALALLIAVFIIGLILVLAYFGVIHR